MTTTRLRRGRRTRRYDDHLFRVSNDVDEESGPYPDVPSCPQLDYRRVPPRRATGE